jgi:type IV pilus assembly protein PilW
MKLLNSHSRSQRGFSLVELMVSLTIGLLILGGVMKIFQSQRANYQLQQAMESVQESGRFLMDFVGADLRMTGYPRDSTNVPTPITGVEGGGVNDSDSVTIQYESTTNCGGDDTGGTMTQNQYLIQNSGATPQLVCIGTITTGTQTYTLVENAEQMQLLYGEDTDSTMDGYVDVFRNADNVTDWTRVVAVRIAWLIRSSLDVGGSEVVSHRLLNEIPVGPYSDGRLRRVFATTITLRNRVPY